MLLFLCFLARCFGFVVRTQVNSRENECHVCAEIDNDQPASAVINFIHKAMRYAKMWSLWLYKKHTRNGAIVNAINLEPWRKEIQKRETQNYLYLERQVKAFSPQTGSDIIQLKNSIH